MCYTLVTVYQHRFQHAWIRHGTGFNDHDEPGRWMLYPDTDDAHELWTFLTIDLEYHRDRVAGCLDALERFETGDIKQGLVDGSYVEPHVVDSGNDGARTTETDTYSSPPTTPTTTEWS